MTALHITEAASQRSALQSCIKRITAGAQRYGRAVRSTLVCIAIRGQLGPSVGYAHDRRPEPPF
jgi:hypothetical protein